MGTRSLGALRTTLMNVLGLDLLLHPRENKKNQCQRFHSFSVCFSRQVFLFPENVEKLFAITDCANLESKQHDIQLGFQLDQLLITFMA
jgi:hypothetical protein